MKNDRLYVCAVFGEKTHVKFIASVIICAWCVYTLKSM